MASGAETRDRTVMEVPTVHSEPSSGISMTTNRLFDLSPIILSLPNLHELKSIRNMNGIMILIIFFCDFILLIRTIPVTRENEIVIVESISSDYLSYNTTSK